MIQQDSPTWSTYDTWHLVLPPSRPDVGDLHHVSSVLCQLSGHPQVAVMGSTPEFRDLLARHEVKGVHVIDNSVVFHDRMTQHMAYASTADEVFINETWQSHFGSGGCRYDLILSDLTLGNVPYVDRVDLYASLTDALNPGGFFVDRVLTNEGHKWGAQEIQEKYSDSPINIRTVNDFNCEAVFCSVLAGDEDGILDTSVAYESLSAMPTPEIEKLTCECQVITPFGMRWYYGKPWATVARDYVRDLTLVSKLPMSPNSPYRDHAFQFTYVK